MSNRTLIILTSIVIACMALLLILPLLPMIWQGKVETYLSYNDVRGIDVTHQHLPYPLNFDQQNTLIELLNRSIPYGAEKNEKEQPSDVNIEKITVYLFNKPDLVLTPIKYNEYGNLLFSAPGWNPTGWMKDVSDGELKKLLSTTYDP